MYCAFICILLVTYCGQIISQSTSGTDHNKCQGSSSETQLLLDKIQSMESEISRLKQFMVKDCSDIQVMYSSIQRGISTITLPGGLTQDVFCDLSTDGGGWLVFQRRQDGSENFYRKWTDYKDGFGRLDGEFWMGNDILATITNQRSYELRVDLEDFEGNKTYAAYSEFSIAGEEDRYRLKVGKYSGTAGDSLSYHNGQQFSTFDRDTPSKCASTYQGAWWYNTCHYSNLNGKYMQGEHSSFADGVNWRHFKGYNYSLKFTEMKIRPK